MKAGGGAVLAVLQQTLFILSFRGRDLPLYTCSTLQINPFSILLIDTDLIKHKKLNISELSSCLLVTEVKLFGVSARCV